MTTLFSSLLSWLVSLVLFVPALILKFVGLLLPACTSLGLVTFTNTILSNVGQFIRLLWPLIKFLPWAGLWNLVSAIILYFFFKWVWTMLPSLMKLGLSFWWVLALVLLLGFANWLISGDWASSSVFTDVFGSSATSTGFSGGGGGGGGGGSW